MLLTVQDIEDVNSRLSKRDDIDLRTKGVSTIRKSGKDFHARCPLDLNLLRPLSHKVFEIHCDEGCSMVDVLWQLSKEYAGDNSVFLVNALKPDDDYTVVHSDLVTIRPGRFIARKLSSSSNSLSVSAKIRSRGRCLCSVQAKD